MFDDDKDVLEGDDFESSLDADDREDDIDLGDEVEQEGPEEKW